MLLLSLVCAKYGAPDPRVDEGQGAEGVEAAAEGRIARIGTGVIRSSGAFYGDARAEDQHFRRCAAVGARRFLFASHGAAATVSEGCVLGRAGGVLVRVVSVWCVLLLVWSCCCC